MTRVDLSRWAYFDSPVPLALAHRGGALLPANAGIENTLAAFRNAVDLGYRHVETDVRVSADDVVYAFHDETLDRVAGHYASFRSLTSDRIDALRVDGREPIPRLSDVLEALPDTRFNVDLKSDVAVEPTIAAVRAAGAADRVCFAGFSDARMKRLSALMPESTSSFAPREIAALKLGPDERTRSAGIRRGAQCVQVPLRRGPLRVVTPTFVRRAHDLGLQVHVWTVDDPQDMHDVLDRGVDGIVSDRIDVLRQVLLERGSWRTP